jgi:threonine dehydrogenase-like Zn-dependent dehydrogenase
LLTAPKLLIDGSGALPYPVPFTPGGGSLGRVHEIGPDTTAFKAGDLVCVDPTVAARDDPSAQILIGTLSGVTEGSAKLASGLWRTGVFAEYAKLPLENVFKLDEARLVGELGYDISDLGMLQTCKLLLRGAAKACSC